LALDQVRLLYQDPKFAFQQVDIRTPLSPEIFKGVDTVIHLAFAIAQGTMTVKEMRENNVGGSLNVFQAAKQADVRKIINLSSVSVYGTGENLDESAPLAPSSRFPYAQQKVELERASETDFPEIEFVHLRAHFILGPRAAPLLRRMLTSRLYVSPPRPHPRIQVVHEEDVAAAILAALDPNVHSGAFNLAAPEIVTFPMLVRKTHLFTVGLPIRWLELAVGKPPPDGSPRHRPQDTALDILRTTLTVSCNRARNLLGWTPRYSAWDARACYDKPAPASLRASQ